MNVYKSIALAACFALLPALAFAQESTPLYAKMAEREFGDSFSLERSKICTLALKTYDYGVKELDLAKSDSKQARRADNALPFMQISLRDATQTDLLFNRAVDEITTEFSVFKSADYKTQKELMKVAKGVNKNCAKPYDDKKLEGYGSLTDAADYLTDFNSGDALGCMGVTLNSLSADRSAFNSGFQQYLVWDTVYEAALRREGYPEDQLIEGIEIQEVKDSMKDLGEAKALSLFDTCPARYKKAHFQASLKKDEPAEVPVIDWK